ncbi:unnamed protein product [Closterium sp. Naga37s-1]|nr:unnamed protein product [Closterium sp. Naga37s-1]
MAIRTVRFSLLGLSDLPGPRVLVDGGWVDGALAVVHHPSVQAGGAFSRPLVGWRAGACTVEQSFWAVAASSDSGVSLCGPLYTARWTPPCTALPAPPASAAAAAAAAAGGGGRGLSGSLSPNPPGVLVTCTSGGGGGKGGGGEECGRLDQGALCGWLEWRGRLLEFVGTSCWVFVEESVGVYGWRLGELSIVDCLSVALIPVCAAINMLPIKRLGQQMLAVGTVVQVRGIDRSSMGGASATYLCPHLCSF